MMLITGGEKQPRPNPQVPSFAVTTQATSFQLPCQLGKNSGYLRMGLTMGGAFLICGTLDLVFCFAAALIGNALTSTISICQFTFYSVIERFSVVYV